MNDRDYADAARARAQRARERQVRALQHEREAEHRAQAATDPETVASLRLEAATHARAAHVHREAIEFQAWHARQHS
jgi:hypothetical protein